MLHQRLACLPGEIRGEVGDDENERVRASCLSQAAVEQVPQGQLEPVGGRPAQADPPAEAQPWQPKKRPLVESGQPADRREPPQRDARPDGEGDVVAPRVSWRLLPQNSFCTRSSKT